MDQDLSPTLEDYLEVIHRIERQQRVTRPRDISRAQNVASSTVTAALQSLAKKGLINYEPYELITLTDEGRARAEELAMRHWIIRDFLENVLGLEAERAEATACGMEHTIDREAQESFVCFLAFTRPRSPDGAKSLQRLRRFIKEGAGGQTCKERVKEYMESLRRISRE